MILAEGDRFLANSGPIALTPAHPTRSKHFFIFLWIKRIAGYNGVGEFPVRSRVDRLAPDKIK
ncbi:hypothetical protein QT971_00255 [Microcoleus sp. herbarium19]|uniref:hypothetical protein n=1 Tax=unclassified Microcoleus TaxID=2642155 RepID=UPI002FD5A97D